MLGETVSSSYNTYVCSSSCVCVSLVTLIITTVHDKEYGNFHADGGNSQRIWTDMQP